MQEAIRTTRAALRTLATLAALPVALVLSAAHVALTALPEKLIGSRLKKNTLIPDLAYNTLRVIMGYKVEFNEAAAPLVRNRQTWYVAKHWSVDDFIVLGSKVKGTFAGKGDILKWPIVAQMARAVKYIGLRRSREFNPQSIAKLNRNFNDGNNAIIFPEATTTRPDKVYLFHAGLITALFGEKGLDKKGREVRLENEVVVQALAVDVVEVEGSDRLGKTAMRDLYCMHETKNDLRRAWERMKIKSMKVVITPLPPLHPADFAQGSDMETPEGRSAAARDLINTAALQVAGVLNPGQTEFEKAPIPGMEHKHKPKTVKA